MEKREGQGLMRGEGTEYRTVPIVPPVLKRKYFLLELTPESLESRSVIRVL